MPFLRKALEPEEALSQLKSCCAGLEGNQGKLTLESIKVTRHKPGRRCLVEYALRLEHGSGPDEVWIVLGKARAKGLDKKAHALLQRFRRSGFGPESEDGISVPEPLGLVPEFRMWLQRKIPGLPLTELLLKANGVKWARRAAEAAYKIHQANLPAGRAHTMADELRILGECLAKVVNLKPEWKIRIEQLLAACERLGATVPEPHPSGIHRDFYPAQVVVETVPQSPPLKEELLFRSWVIDFDLYCQGDPALDIGNFIAHMTEQAVRELGDPLGLVRQERALEERFLELAGPDCQLAIKAYGTLTLARHIYLSTQFPTRQAFTERLIELCEQRLGLV